MHITKHECWATPVWERQTGFDKKFNEKLLSEFPRYDNSSNNFNIWECEGDCINQVKNRFLDFSKQLGEYFEEVNLVMDRGWVSTQLPGEELSLHSHGGCILSGVYYINVPDNSGDLLLVDPRGGINWEKTRDGKILGVKYKRIHPFEGTMVLFTPYVMHMVEANKSNKPRISLATNILNKKISV